MDKKEIQIGVFSRPHPKELLNGDGYFYKYYDDVLVAAVIDGLGHGQGANKATTAAIDYLENNGHKLITPLLQGMNESLRDTRGIVISLLRFEYASRKIIYAGVGNIVARVIYPDGIKFFSLNGIIGQNLRKVREIVIPSAETFFFILHSDGIVSKFNHREIDTSLSVQVIAEQTVQNFARPNDDATVMVLRGV